MDHRQNLRSPGQMVQQATGTHHHNPQIQAAARRHQPRRRQKRGLQQPQRIQAGMERMLRTRQLESNPDRHSLRIQVSRSTQPRRA